MNPKPDTGALRAALEQATGGEWRADIESKYRAHLVIPKYYPDGMACWTSIDNQFAANVEFIALAHNAMGDLLDTIERYKAALQEISELDDEWGSEIARKALQAVPPPAAGGEGEGK